MNSDIDKKMHEHTSVGASFSGKNGNSNGTQGNGSSMSVKPFQVKKLSHEEVSKLLDALEKMRQSGIPPTDHRYLAILKVLKIQTQFGTQLTVANFPQLATQAYLLQSQPHSSQSSSQSSLQHQSQQVHALPSQPQPMQTVPNFSSQSLPSSNLQTNHSFSSQPSATSSEKKIPLNSYQVFQLKAQIMAYKYLSKKLAVASQALNSATNLYNAIATTR